MSTEIAKISGLENEEGGRHNVSLEISSFYGGPHRGGKCLQLTFPYRVQYGQLTRLQVAELAGVLIKWLSETSTEKS